MSVRITADRARTARRAIDSVWKGLFVSTALIGFSFAKNIYVNPSASSGGDGTNWAAALGALPQESTFWSGVGAGDTIFVAGGRYSDTWRIRGGGSAGNPLVIRRATASKHGTDKGWSSAYDAPAVLQHRGIRIEADHVEIDGGAISGLVVVVPAADRAMGVEMSNPHVDLTLRRLEIKGPGTNDAHNTRAIDITPSRGKGRGLLIDQCEMHNISNGLYTVNFDDVIVENSYIHDINNSGHIHENAWFAQGTNNAIFRYNRMERTTAEGVFLRADTRNWKIYGNLFVDADMGVATKSGYSHKDTYVYNNTFVNVHHAIAFKDGGDNGEVANNIFYPTEKGVMLNKSMRRSHNWYGGSTCRGEQGSVAGNGEDPFENRSAGDFRLKAVCGAVDKGKSLASEYCRDRDGIDRPAGDGWDIGAYERAGQPIAQDGTQDDPEQPVSVMGEHAGGGAGSGDESVDGFEESQLSQTPQAPLLLFPASGDTLQQEPVLFEWVTTVDEDAQAHKQVLLVSDSQDFSTAKKTVIGETKETATGPSAAEHVATFGALSGLLLVGGGAGLRRRRRWKWLGKLLVVPVLLGIAAVGCSSDKNPMNNSPEKQQVFHEARVDDLDGGKTYYWKVMNVDADGNEVSSEVRNFVVE
jgi:hypothetical protein